ncbi:MAG: hypothetical protein H0T51_16925 [Pirellulales bacterium]|nr:hypothetical protein [Pirellulales bacterium]
MPAALTAEQSDLAVKIRALAAKCSDDKQTWTADDESEWDRANARYDQLAGESRRDRRMIGREDRYGVPGGSGGDDHRRHSPIHEGEFVRDTRTGK